MVDTQKTEPESVESPEAIDERARDSHAFAGGNLCEDRGDGTCVECGVALVFCDSCGSRGYHHAGCTSTPADESSEKAWLDAVIHDSDFMKGQRT